MLLANASPHSNSSLYALLGIRKYLVLPRVLNAPFVLLFLFASLPIHAQYQLDPAQQVGIQPYGSYHGGNLDAVNMMNGNLTVRVPVYSLPQLGKVGLSFSIVLNNAGWGLYKTGSSASGSIEKDYYRREPLGAQLIFDQDIWPNQFYNSYQLGTLTAHTDYMYEGFQVVSGDFSTNPLLYDSSNMAQLRSVDGAGYLFKPQASFPSSPTGWPQSDYQASFIFSYGWLRQVALGTLYTPDGVSYSYTSTGETITDPDGNVITITGAPNISSTPWQAAMNGTSTTTSIMDSVGRQVLPPLPLSNQVNGCPVLNAQNQPLVGSRVWNVPGPNGSSSQYLLCYATVTVNTGFTFNDGSGTGCSGSTITYCNFEYTSTGPLLQSLVLPNSTYYGFVYDSAPGGTSTVAYGDLVEMTFPDGGSISYAYGTSTYYPSGNSYQSRYVQTRTAKAGATSPQYQWSYTIPTAQWGYPYNSSVKDPDGNVTQYSYTWFQSPNSTQGSFLETNRQVYQGAASGGTLLQGTQTSYVQYSFPSNGYFDGPQEFLPHSKTTTTATGLTATETYQYDAGFSPTDPVCQLSGGNVWNNCSNISATASFPLGAKTNTVTTGYSGSTLRQELTPYYFQSHPTYLATNFLHLPASDTIEDSAATPLSASTYTYDESGYVASTASPLGHVTTTSKWISGGSYATSHSWWNAKGTLNRQIDPNGTCATTYAYSSTYANAYPTGITNCLNQTTGYLYDFNTGQKTQVTDPNQQKTQYTYNDPLGRLTAVNYPDGGSARYQYNDSASPPNVLGNEAISATATKSTEIDIDGFGRQVTTKLLSDPEGTVEVDTTYDGLGRVRQVSNPYRSISESTYGNTVYAYDALSRKTSQTNPDNTVEQWCYDNIATAGQSNCHARIASSLGEWVDFADENGNDWQRTSDALGRLTSAIEPNGTSAAPAMETDYNYDALNNLKSVTQWGGVSGTAGARSRSFGYDSLSRLVAASNPENASATYPPSRTCSGVSGTSWTTCYGYDSNSNLKSKTDNRNVIVGYNYDLLNRLLSKTYSDGTTPSSCYQYDSSSTSMSIGRLSAEWTQAGSCPGTAPATGFMTMRTLLAYDPMGRVLSEQQCTPNASGPGNCTSPSPNPFTLSYLHDLAGNSTAYTNGVSNVPSVGSITFGLQYNGAGRLQNLISSWNPAAGSSGAPLPLFTADPTNGYSAPGAIQDMILGNNIVVIKTYDSRLRTITETATHP